MRLSAAPGSAVEVDEAFVLENASRRRVDVLVAPTAPPFALGGDLRAQWRRGDGQSAWQDLLDPNARHALHALEPGERVLVSLTFRASPSQPPAPGRCELVFSVRPSTG